MIITVITSYRRSALGMKCAANLPELRDGISYALTLLNCTICKLQNYVGVVPTITRHIPAHGLQSTPLQTATYLHRR